jgi:hypothetical protein
MAADGNTGTSPILMAVLTAVALVGLPSVALYFGFQWISSEPIVGLPVMAIFGVMILIGSLSLTSAVFHHLGLSSRTEALALPTGSIRATIALSLIVLFAIIAIMLFQSLAAPKVEPYWVTNVTESDLVAIEKASFDRVVVALPSTCAAPRPASAASAPSAPGGGLGAVGQTSASTCYRVQLVPAISRDATDLAKQLLTLIGTLMTALTSYYFAAKGARSDDGNDSKPGAKDQHVGIGGSSAPSPSGVDSLPQDDGCGTPVIEPTPDEELPAATGGGG